MMERPAICVLIPVFGDQPGIRVTLAHLAADPCQFDVLVVDDGSPAPIRCPPQCGPHAITLVRTEPNRGIEHALNTGIEHIRRAGYRYIARLDAGDVAVLGRFARQQEFLERNPDVGVVGTWAECIDHKGNYLFTLRLPAEHSAIVRKQRYVAGLLHPSVMIRAAILSEVGTYSDKYKTGEDHELFARIARRYRVANIPEVLTRYVISPAGTTSKRRRRTLIARLKIQLANFSLLDPHAYLGVARTILFMVLPFAALTATKRVLWR